MPKNTDPRRGEACLALGLVNQAEIPKSTFPKAVRSDAGSPASGGGSARGGNPLDSRDRCPQECNLRETKTQGSQRPCPSHSSGRSRSGETSRGRVGSRAEGDARNVRRQEGSITVVFEPCIGDVAQLGEHLPCTQGVTGSSPVISTSTLTTE